MKIGLVGEAPNDTSAIQNLLSRKYLDVDFVTLIDRIHGSMLDNKKMFSRLLRIEYESHAPDVIIFIRDLDALETDLEAKRKRKEVFSASNSIVDKKGIFLLNIYELEAIILADINSFNNYYGTEIPGYADPMKVVMPKEVLIGATKSLNNGFNVSHTPQLFGLLNFELVKQNSGIFQRSSESLRKQLEYKKTFISKLSRAHFTRLTLNSTVRFQLQTPNQLINLFA